MLHNNGSLQSFSHNMDPGMQIPLNKLNQFDALLTAGNFDGNQVLNIAGNNSKNQQQLINDRKFFMDLVPTASIQRKYIYNWPKLFAIQLIFISLSRILSLSSDILLLFTSIDYEAENENILFPFKFGDGILRFILVFGSGIIVVMCFHSMYHSLNKNYRIQCCCLPIKLLIEILIYKVVMIVYAIYNIIKVITFFTDDINSKIKQYIISKKLTETNAKLNDLFFIEKMLSSWPLWILSLYELQLFVQNNEQITFEIILLIVKVCSSGINIIIGSNKLKKLVLCHFREFAILIRCRESKRFTNKIEGILPTQLFENPDLFEISDMKCVVCNNSISHSESFYHCGLHECQQYLCIQCSWDYNIKTIFGWLGDVALSREMIKTYEKCDIFKTEMMTGTNTAIKEQLGRRNSQGIENSICHICYHIFALTVCLLMINAFIDVVIANKYESHNILLFDSLLFIIIGAILNVIRLCVAIPTAICYNDSKIFQLISAWIFNIHDLFFIFGFLMTFWNWNVLWKMGNTVRAALVLFCIFIGPINIWRIFEEFGTRRYLEDIHPILERAQAKNNHYIPRPTPPQFNF
eukprot:311417_1